MTRLSSPLAASALLAIIIGWTPAAHAGPQPRTFGVAGAAQGHVLTAIDATRPGNAMCRGHLGFAHGGGGGPLPPMRAVMAGRRSAVAELVIGNGDVRPGDRQQLLATLLLVAGACGGLAPGLDDDAADAGATTPLPLPPPPR
jgi:hypothetical protein